MYPKKVSLFVPWSKAMVAGATVGSPDYGKSNSKTTSTRKTRRKRKKRRKKRHNASKET